MDKPATRAPVRNKFSRYEKVVIGILGFLQFTVILDFMIISPLGAIVMPTLHISPQQFGLAVSSYAFSAGVSGFLAAGFADRFDRKRLLLFFYFGFMLGTLLCALATSYPLLLLARIVTGLFGGVIGSVVLAIATDLFPLEMRGRVMGVISTAFAASQVLGLPAGLYLTSHWDWHAPFLAIIAVGVPAGLMIMLFMRPIVGHLALKQEHSPLTHLINTITEPRYRLAFLLVMLLPTGGYMLMPFGTAYMVNNVGLSFTVLPVIYLVTGVSAIFVGPLVGKASDSFGKFPMFCFGSIVTLHHGADLDEYRPRAAGHGHRDQRDPVRGHLLADDPGSGADLGYPGTHQARRLQRRQRFVAAVRGWDVSGSGRLAHRSEAKWLVGSF